MKLAILIFIIVTESLEFTSKFNNSDYEVLTERH